MATSDSQRREYLKLMGVQPYYPRRPLPGAKPVRQYAEGILRHNNALASAQPIQAASVQDALRVFAANPQPERVEPIKPKAAVENATLISAEKPMESAAPRIDNAPLASSSIPSEAVQATSGEEVRFAFAYFPINEQFAVINELPWSAAVTVSVTCRKLLADILKALGVEVPERNLNPMVFTWPLFEGAPADLNAENARQTLEGFVAKRLRLLPIKTLLVLAEQSSQFLFPADFGLEHGARLKHPRHDVEVVLTHSLNAMEAVPDLKRSVWKTLQPLRGHLAGKAQDTKDGHS